MDRNVAAALVAVEAAIDGIVTVSADGSIISANPMAHSMFGWPEGALVGMDVGALMTPDDAAAHASHVAGYLATGIPRVLGATRTMTGQRRDGSTFPVDLRAIDVHIPGMPVLFTATLRDASQRLAVENSLRHMAVTDPLTGTANRSAVTDQLEQALSRASGGPGTAVLLIDLDQFKTVNDSLGHGAGDSLLRSVAGRLARVVNDPDVVGRLGGDEFVVVCRRASIDATNDLVRRVVDAIASPHEVGGHRVTTSASIGVVTVTGTPLSAEEVLRRADLAVFRAKALGGNRHEFYAGNLEDVAATKLVLQNDLRDALARDQVLTYYQPIFCIPRLALVGVEALVRFEHPVRGILQPADFLDVAESGGLVPSLDEQVIGRALDDLADWSRTLPDLTMSVNVSAHTLVERDVFALVASAVRRRGLPASRVCIEITERSVLSLTSSALEGLRRLRDLGVQVAVDDFGTGYSSLTHLKQVPVSRLKVDRSFTAGLAADRRDTAIVSGLIEMASHLQLDVVAEGVETGEQLRHLERLGCHFAQGYLLGRPMSAVQLSALLGIPVSLTSPTAGSVELRVS